MRISFLSSTVARLNPHRSIKLKVELQIPTPPTARNPCRPINTDPSHKRKVPHSLPLHCNGGCRGEQREHREGVPKGECSRTAQPRRQNKGGGCSALVLDSFLFSQSCFAFLLPCFYFCPCPKLSFLFSFPSKHCYDEMIFVV